MNQVEQKGWWGRNWKWFVPVGCLGTITLVVGGIVLIVAMIFSIIKSTDVYEDALSRAQESPVVVEALGSPVEAGFFLSGNFHVSGSSGNANLRIPISGPDGKGTICAMATKSAGEWKFTTLVVKIKGPDGQRINLLE